nr:RecName: Full=Unknown protein from spot P3 of 2D-PAGE of heart tissue [Rattus norvegicus]
SGHTKIKVAVDT